jgi:hypothetical protein
VNGTDEPAYAAEDTCHLADGSGTTSISADWVKVRFSQNLQAYFDLILKNGIRFIILLRPSQTTEKEQTLMLLCNQQHTGADNLCYVLKIVMLFSFLSPRFNVVMLHAQLNITPRE